MAKTENAIWVVAQLENGETLGVTYELLGQARRLADALGLEVIEEGELPFWDNGVKYFTVLGPNREKVEFNQYL